MCYSLNDRDIDLLTEAREIAKLLYGELLFSDISRVIDAVIENRKISKNDYDELAKLLDTNNSYSKEKEKKQTVVCNEHVKVTLYEKVRVEQRKRKLMWIMRQFSAVLLNQQMLISSTTRELISSDSAKPIRIINKL